jgi:hypothetical protein
LDYKDVKQNSMFGWGDNPFKIANENSNAFKGRLFNIASTYEIDQNFSFMARIEWITLMILDGQKTYSRYTQGMYREQTIAFTEYNADMLLSYDNTLEIFL